MTFKGMTLKTKMILGYAAILALPVYWDSCTDVDGACQPGVNYYR